MSEQNVGTSHKDICVLHGSVLVCYLVSKGIYMIGQPEEGPNTFMSRKATNFVRKITTGISVMYILNSVFCYL